MLSQPRLSVVIASVESGHTLDAALKACRRSCENMPCEIFVVDASRDGSAEIAAGHEGVQVVREVPGTLVPSLWAEGIRRSRGRFVALSTGHCIVSPGWAGALTGELEAGADVVGCGVIPAPGLGALDHAVLLLRYGRFLDQARGEARAVEDVPGDNAAYHGDALREYTERNPGGFWELDYHREVSGAGGAIRAVPAAVAQFGRSFPVGTILKHRYEHGWEFAKARVERGDVSRIRIVAPAVLVPLVLLGRATRLGLRAGYPRWALLKASPFFLLLAMAWALGEATGALLGPGRSSTSENR